MTGLIETANYILALGGIVLLLSSAILIFDLKVQHALERLVQIYGLVCAFFLTLLSSIMTLVYSEVFGFAPCGLCWLQRVFLYPQVFLLGAALYFRDTFAARYGIALSVPGLVIALYQHYLQIGGKEFVTCPTVAQNVDCASRTLFEFGFMTFPLVSAAAFLFLIVLYTYLLRRPQM